MIKESGLVIVGVLLLVGLTAAVALGSNNAVPPGSNQGQTYSQPRGWGGMMGGGMGRGMMGYQNSYGSPSTNPNAAPGWSLSGMWSRCAGFMSSLWQSQQANQIIIAGYGFAPQVITVKAGTSITWTNYDFAVHGVYSGTLIAPNSLFDSGNLSQSFSYTFTNAGVYTYYCDEHPGMVGVVIVEA